MQDWQQDCFNWENLQNLRDEPKVSLKTPLLVYMHRVRGFSLLNPLKQNSISMEEENCRIVGVHSSFSTNNTTILYSWSKEKLF